MPDFKLTWDFINKIRLLRGAWLAKDWSSMTTIVFDLAKLIGFDKEMKEIQEFVNSVESENYLEAAGNLADFIHVLVQHLKGFQIGNEFTTQAKETQADEFEYCLKLSEKQMSGGMSASAVNTEVTPQAIPIPLLFALLRLGFDIFRSIKK